MKAKLMVFLLLAGSTSAQTGQLPERQSHTGCVTATPDDAKSFVLSEAGACYLLQGKLATKRLAGHVVTVRGTTTDATDHEPLMLTIEGIDAVAAACRETCTLDPPGHRGLKRKPKTGTPGGTPGE